jgi:rod shape-determining protein MreC
MLFKTKILSIKTLKFKESQLPDDVVVSKVIHNSYVAVKTLNSGSLLGIKPDMGVVNNLGLVVIDKTSQNTQQLSVFTDVDHKSTPK